MSPVPPHPPEYVEARNVLLDALEALGPEREAVVLAGAQAVYLRTASVAMPATPYAPGNDLLVDPARLGDAPSLDELRSRVPAAVAIELVPSGDPPEAALVDNDELPVGALDPDDTRVFPLRVAGVAALMVAKAHSLLSDTDAADVYRLVQASSPVEVASRLKVLQRHPTVAAPTEEAIEDLMNLFGADIGLGIEMAARCLRTAVTEDKIRADCLAYFEALGKELWESLPEFPDLG
jgi:hypothetical protein